MAIPLLHTDAFFFLLFFNFSRIAWRYGFARSFIPGTGFLCLRINLRYQKGWDGWHELSEVAFRGGFRDGKERNRKRTFCRWDLADPRSRSVIHMVARQEGNDLLISFFFFKFRGRGNNGEVGQRHASCRIPRHLPFSPRFSPSGNS